jgi:hypothetical protein
MTTGESPMAGRSANPRAGLGGHSGRRIPHGNDNDTTPARDNGRTCFVRVGEDAASVNLYGGK